MFERFTERAREVVVLAQDEAQRLKHNWIGTEHLLLGLLREEEGLAARVLASLGVTVDPVRAQVVQIVGSGKEVSVGQIPFTPRAKKVLELALREALSLGHNYIGMEHILLGLVRENEGVATRVMLGFNADSERVRAEVIRMLSTPDEQARIARVVAKRRKGRGRFFAPAEFSEALDGAEAVLEQLIAELKRPGRPADAGDVLVLLALVPGGLAARVLGKLGVEPDALARTADELRQAAGRSVLLPTSEELAELKRTRLAKEAAIRKQEFELAATLRDRERELLRRAPDADTAGHERDLLAAVRERLGLGDEAVEAEEAVEPEEAPEPEEAAGEDDAPEPGAPKDQPG